MSVAHAVTLGILQGLGEFLPISSSGHLIVFPWLMGWPDSGLAFDVALHLGTLAAVGLAFWRDWADMLGAAARGALAGRPLGDPRARLLFSIALASVPGAIAGLVLDEWAETVFRSPFLVAFDLAAFGLLLGAADRRARPGEDEAEVSLRDALLIGLAQAVAIVPGSSRSGVTITMALFLGHRRASAARFSFLLALPITLGAAMVKVPELFDSGAAPAPIAAGMLAAAGSGILAIRVLLAYVQTKDYRPFVYYRVAFALFLVVLLLARGGNLG